jgi:ADP-ribosyl-[dinitrogen reductase] hydrolase
MSAPDHDTLRIDSVDVPGVGGRLGLCACPGTRRGQTDPDRGRENLSRDIDAIQDFGAAGLVTLVQDGELAMLGLSGLPEELEDRGMWWKHMPITDMGIPGRPFESRWLQEGPEIHQVLARGEHVVLHCWAGLGRTGTIAARLLIENGLEPEAAILRLRNARPGSIQTRKQERYVLRLRPPGR